MEPLKEMSASSPKPTKEQLEWADSEFGVLFHYDVQVFEPSYTDWRKQWGYQPDPAIFAPSSLNTDQWIQSAAAAGATYAILTAKHCSGFCLWPTEVHDYSVKNAPWRDGKGDIVGDFIRSCRKYGVRPGLYYSTSANAFCKVDNPGLVKSGDAQEQQRYNGIVERQVTELWSNYGELFEIWFDGGTLPPEQSGPDVKSILMRLQPQAVCFNGPKEIASLIRWVGNESGDAPNPCWSTTDIVSRFDGHAESPLWGAGNPEGAIWAPAETDMPIRRHQWFWYKDEEHLLLPLGELVDCYYSSVGSNTNLLLGLVIDDRGRVPDPDVQRLEEFGAEIRRRFARPSAETSGSGKEVTLELEAAAPIDHVLIMEDLSAGERIREYMVQGLTDNGWITLCRGQSVGHKRIETFEPIQVSKIRLITTACTEEPIIRKLAVYDVNGSC